MTKGDIQKIERVQKRATRMVIELRSLDYVDRLDALGLTTLDGRRKRGDLIQIYKIINGIEKVELDWQTGGRGDYIRRHRYQIEREICRNCPIRNNFLLNRNATTWNLLPPDIVEANTVNSFKARIDRHMKMNALRRSVYRV